MHTDLFVKDEQVLARTAHSSFIFTNKRIIISKSDQEKPTSILLESIKRLELVHKRNNAIGFVCVLLFFAVLFTAFQGNYITLAPLAIILLISSAIFYFKYKSVLKISAEKEKVIIDTKKFNTDAQELVNKLEYARFERLNQLFKSDTKAKNAENPKTIKISA